MTIAVDLGRKATKQTITPFLQGLPLNCLLAGALTIFPLEIFHEFLLSADFFQNQLFQKNLSGIPTECQTD